MRLIKISNIFDDKFSKVQDAVLSNEVYTEYSALELVLHEDEPMFSLILHQGISVALNAERSQETLTSFLSDESSSESDDKSESDEDSEYEEEYYFFETSFSFFLFYLVKVYHFTYCNYFNNGSVSGCKQFMKFVYIDFS